MRTRHAKKLVASGLGLIALVCLWFYFAPVGLGGSTSYVDTDGISMEPRFHTGDLVLVRSQSSYHVGEIVAYHSTVFHTVVLHRIIGRAGARYVFKGDNNNFSDFEHPAGSQLIGALWLHIPGAGGRLASLRSPALVGALVGFGMFLFAGAAFTQRQRRRRRQRRAAENAQRSQRRMPQRSAEPVVGVLAIGLVALLPFVALAVLAFTRTPTALLPSNIPYKQSGTVSYSANAAPGPAYPGNRAVTGDPLFTHVISVVKLRFGYLFHAAAAHSLAGKASLYATVASTSGWQRTLELGRPTYFRGDRALVTATLDLSSLLALLRRLETTTAVSGSYTLTLVPRVNATGNLDVLPLRTTFSPQIQFSLSQLEVQPVVAAGGSPAPGQSPASPFAPSASGSVTGRRYQPLFVSLEVARLSVATARKIALGAIAVIVCALLAMVAFVRPRLRDESAAIRARYGRLLIPVARVWQRPGAAVIDVEDMEALVRIAERYDRSVLHETSDEGEAFWVTDESGQFRYAVGASAYTVDGEVVDQSPPAPLVSDMYAAELEFGGAVSVYETQSAAETFDTGPAVEDDWTAQDAADAVVQESEDWRAACEAADVVYADELELGGRSRYPRGDQQPTPSPPTQPWKTTGRPKMRRTRSSRKAKIGVRRAKSPM
jgi:signal peptidase I